AWASRHCLAEPEPHLSLDLLRTLRYNSAASWIGRRKMATPGVAAYEQLLDRDPRWALREGSMHFERESAVHKTLERIVQRLDELGIPYALAGGMALFLH